MSQQTIARTTCSHYVSQQTIARTTCIELRASMLSYLTICIRASNHSHYVRASMLSHHSRTCIKSLARRTSMLSHYVPKCNAERHRQQESKRRSPSLLTRKVRASVWAMHRKVHTLHLIVKMPSSMW